MIATLGVVHPHLLPSASDLEAARADLEPAWRDYTSHVSPDSMAISLETAGYIDCLARTAGFAADFGSGFTSYVLRRRVAHVVSVDDSPTWLGWTRQFLTRHDLPTGGLVLFDEFAGGEFDLVVYDYSCGDAREAQMGFAADQVRPGGVIVFDDAQHAGHQEQMRAVAAERRWDLFGLHEWTTDRFGRFAAMIVRP